MPTQSNIPLSLLGLTTEDITRIQETYTEFENIFPTNTDTNYAIPAELITDGPNVNTDLLLNLFKQHNIRPKQVFNYCAEVFKLASKQPPEQQKQAIANADEYITNTDKEQLYQELEELEHKTNTTFFDLLHINYHQQAEQLLNRLQYEDTPNKNDLWEINLKNIQTQNNNPNINKQINIVVEGFILPDEYEDDTLFDSPVLARVVGEYEQSGLEDGDMFVATPAAFTNGTFIKNLETK